MINQLLIERSTVQHPLWEIVEKSELEHGDTNKKESALSRLLGFQLGTFIDGFIEDPEHLTLAHGFNEDVE